jgi:hypothetical protein
VGGAINANHHSRPYVTQTNIVVGDEFIKSCLEIETKNNLSISKERFIFEQFKADYPNYYRRFNYDLVTELASRSPEVARWLYRTNETWRLISDQPDYMRDYVSPDLFKQIKGSIEAYKALLRERAVEAQKLAEEHSKKVEQLQKKFSTKLESTRENDLVFIWSMSSAHLPLDRQVDIVLAVHEADPAKREKLNAQIQADVRAMKIAALEAWKNNTFKRDRYPLDGIAFVVQ